MRTRFVPTVLVLAALAVSCGSGGDTPPASTAAPAPYPATGTGPVTEAAPATIDPSVDVDEQLRLAIIDGDTALAGAAVEAGADIEAPEPRLKLRPLHIAATNDQSEIISLLIDAGAEIDGLAVGDLTPLHVAARSGSVRATDTLLGAGSDPTLLSSESLPQAPLHMAARGGHVEVIEVLLDFGVDVDQLEETDSTALMYAAAQGHADAAAVLLERGADATIRDRGGQTALYWASNDAVATVLQAAGAPL
jgi:ankyrin repeat protein